MTNIEAIVEAYGSAESVSTAALTEGETTTSSGIPSALHMRQRMRREGASDSEGSAHGKGKKAARTAVRCERMPNFAAAQ